MKWLGSFFKKFNIRLNREQGSVSTDKEMPSPEQIVDMIATTTDDEIDCDQAFELMHQYADLVDSGQDAGALLPAVKKHIENCKDCREELEALLRAIQSSE
jgi:hypothetical protein